MDSDMKSVFRAMSKRVVSGGTEEIFRIVRKFAEVIPYIRNQH